MYLVHSVTGVTVTMVGEDRNLVRWMTKMGYEEVDMEATLADVEAVLEPEVEVVEAPKVRKPRKTASKE